jgi:hypothetical protein
MLGAAKLLRISRKLCRFKNSVLSFGGLTVLFSGDFNQLPAVCDRCLYREIFTATSLRPLTVVQEVQNQGLLLWRTVTDCHVVLLEHNYRAVDPSLQSTLTRIRQRQTTVTDLNNLRDRVLSSIHGPNIDDPKWRDALFITTRNVVRQAWNHQSAVRHLATTSHQIFISPAADTNVHPQNMDQVIWEIDANTEKLATWNLLCVGGPVVVTTNIAVELGIANGTRAVVKEVIPHPLDETGWYQATRERIIALSRPPICVWIEPVCPQMTGDVQATPTYSLYNDGDEARRNWFPVLPTKPQDVTLKKSSISFKRVQIPLTPCNTTWQRYILRRLITFRLCIVRS